ncbi:MgtC/SapB family protein [Cohnella thailandensis]|uniref:MgtC/SapB family protein n=1 Tax=Cohnella thailandensis TaxID=557557 RepID=A0A841T1M8_9BACL|nr:MgtC/SapB family protein [Cohnella thailandensis]MBB6638074.1 MgtC/SapB family protein [Cohnella thailandensis]MBP1972000.1 putative Mg2+ transporter-C (MgtC) family protein [Cohnella thailandensis]
MMFALKLGAAMALGLLIGIDRQLRHKPLGIKTSMVIAVASCLITLVSIEAVARFAQPGMTNMDPMRLAAQIVSGIGFIGAGAILRRSNDGISGLTTAAMVWSSAALGVAAGAGFFKEAFVSAALIIVAVNLVPSAIRLIGPSRLREKEISVCLTVAEPAELGSVIDRIRLTHHVKHTKIRDSEDGRREVRLVLSATDRQSTEGVYAELKSMKPILFVEVESIGT